VNRNIQRVSVMVIFQTCIRDVLSKESWTRLELS
jgi:hypothetical protein